MSFSERLKALMEEKQVTWAKVSKDLNIGINQRKYWETHNKAPNGETLMKLAHYFSVTPDYLMGIETLKEKSMTILDDPTLVLTAEEKWFIQKLRELDKEGRTMVESTLIAETRRVSVSKGESVNAG